MGRAAINPIATLTLNPTVDVSYTIPGLIADQKVHATRAHYDPGGNGVNVARGLRALGISAHACLIVAGEIGALLERLLAHHVGHLHPVQVAGETRINCTLLQENPRAQYEVDGIGPRVTEEALDQVSEAFLRFSEHGIGVLTGSIPPGVHRTVYAQLVRKLRERGGRAVVDAQSSLLQAALPERPFLIKPNRYELELLCGRKLPTLEGVAKEAQLLHEEGVAHVCVSLGGEGALLVDESGTYYARAPQVRVVSTVGAGDSMVAGLVAGLVQRQDPPDVLRLGVACGSATAAKPGTEIFTAPEVTQLLDEVKVEKLEG
jgi:6-phosphofructokinase 2